MAKDIIKFWAPWCGPCNQYTSTFEKVKQELLETANFFEVNVDEDTQELTSEYKIKGIPCTVIVKDGMEIARQSGALTEDQLRDFILLN